MYLLSENLIVLALFEVSMCLDDLILHNIGVKRKSKKIFLNLFTFVVAKFTNKD